MFRIDSTMQYFGYFATAKEAALAVDRARMLRDPDFPCNKLNLPRHAWHADKPLLNARKRRLSVEQFAEECRSCSGKAMTREAGGSRKGTASKAAGRAPSPTPTSSAAGGPSGTGTGGGGDGLLSTSTLLLSPAAQPARSAGAGADADVGADAAREWLAAVVSARAADGGGCGEAEGEPASDWMALMGRLRLLAFSSCLEDALRLTRVMGQYQRSGLGPCTHLCREACAAIADLHDIMVTDGANGATQLQAAATAWLDQQP